MQYQRGDGTFWENEQIVSPFAPGFPWDAKVFFPNEFLHVRLLDSYTVGKGAGKVKVLSDCRTVQGMRIPFKGEVGWYHKEHLVIVWKGIIDKAAFHFVSSKL